MRSPRSNRIAEQRRAKGLSQQQLAEKLGVHWTTISKLERGITRLDFDWVDKVCQALDVEEHEILPAARRITKISLSGYIHHGGEVVSLEEHQSKVWEVNSSLFEDIDTVWVEVRHDALYPYFKDGDLLGLTWARDDERLDSQGEVDYSGFFGRFCLVQDHDGAQFMGIAAPSNSRDTIDLHNANFPPLQNIKPHALAQVTVAIMRNPAMRQPDAESAA